MSHLKVFLFGPPRIEHNSTSIEIQRRKTLGLLIYLVSIAGQSYSRDKLAALFWPETDQAGARANLRRDLSRLRQSLGEKALVLEGDRVSWNPDYDLWLDVHEFNSRLEKAACHPHPQGALCRECATGLEAAVSLYGDDFLAGFNLAASAEFDDWQFFQAEELRHKLAESLQALISCYTMNQEFSQAVPHARRWLALDNLNEQAHQTLMRLYSWSGEPAAALRQYEECARLLREKLKIPPDEVTTQLYEDIKLKRLEPAPALQVEKLPGPPPAMGFPNTVYSFIGREKEMAKLVELLKQPDVRLVTIVGLGGVGKTRLSVEAARCLLEEAPGIVPDGGAFLSLASLDDPANLPYSIAKELRLNISGQLDPMIGLAYALEKRRMLLLMDNFEQLVEGAPMLEELLNRCPGVKMLVTSREPLRLSFEWRLDLDGLPYPDPDMAEGDELGAIRLFMQTAEQVRPGFPLNETTRPLIYRLCARLAGLPLAIHLAASWLRAMTIEQIVGEVERGLDILTSQMRDIPDRHRSMNAVFEATWDMLSSEEQRAFAALSVFRGGFTASAAQQVAEVSPYLLAGLVDRGLVRFLSDLRYEYHELTRQFAASKLKDDQPTRSKVYSRHSAHFLDMLQKVSPALYGADPGETLQVLKNELSNIRQAWDWAVQNLSLAELQPFIQPLTDFYEIAGYLVIAEKSFWSAIQKHGDRAAGQAEMHSLFELWMNYCLFLIFEGRNVEALEHVARLEQLADALKDPICQADACQIRGLAYSYMGRRSETVELFKEAVELYRPLDAPRRMVYALNMLGEGLSFVLRPREAIACHQEALEISRRTGQRRMEALSLSHMGVSYYYLDGFYQAIHYWEEAVECFEQVGDKRGEGRTRNNLSFIYCRLGEYEKARKYGEESLGLLAQVGDRLSEGNTNDTLGEAYFGLGMYEEARRCFKKAIQVNHEMLSAAGDMASFHANLAMVEIATGNYAEAESLLEQGVPETSERHPKEIARSLRTRSRLYERSGRLQQALGPLDQAIQLLEAADDPLLTSELLLQKGSLLLAIGQPQKAWETLAEALPTLELGRVAPSLFEARLLAAQILNARGEKNEALQNLEELQASAAKPAQRAAIHYALWQIDGKAEEARAALRHYTELASRTPDVVYLSRRRELEGSLGARAPRERAHKEA